VVSQSYGDRADGADKLRALKKQIESQKREIAQLRKELAKMTQRMSEMSDLEDEEDDKPSKRSKSKHNGSHCEKCNEGVYALFQVTVAGVDKKYYTCSVCGNRKAQK
jgi:phage shock protein A